MKKYSIPKGIEKEAAEYIQGVLAELENRGVLENIDICWQEITAHLSRHPNSWK